MYCGYIYGKLTTQIIKWNYQYKKSLGSKRPGNWTQLLTSVCTIKLGPFRITFDSSPNISHSNQISQVIRYVKILNKKIKWSECSYVFSLYKEERLLISAQTLLKNVNVILRQCSSNGGSFMAVFTLFSKRSTTTLNSSDVSIIL